MNLSLYFQLILVAIKISGMPPSFNLSCFGECNQSCAGSFIYQWALAYFSPDIHVNLGITLALTLISCPLTVGLNGLAIYIIVSNPLLRDIPSNISLALLSVTDFFVGSICQPVFIALAACRMSGSCNSCILYTILYKVFVSLCRASVYHLWIVSVDRLIAVKFPYRYPTLVTSWRIVYVSIMTWAYIFLMAIIRLVYADANILQIVETVFAVIDIVIILIIIVNYVIMYIEARRHSTTIQTDQVPGNESQEHFTQGALRATETTFLVTCSVFVTNLVNGAAFAYIFYKYPLNKSLFNVNIYFSVECWFLMLIMLNSLLNPMIYIFRSKKLSQEMKRKLHFCIPSIKTNQIGAPGNIELESIDKK